MLGAGRGECIHELGAGCGECIHELGAGRGECIHELGAGRGECIHVLALSCYIGSGHGIFSCGKRREIRCFLVNQHGELTNILTVLSFTIPLRPHLTVLPLRPPNDVRSITCMPSTYFILKSEITSSCIALYILNISTKCLLVCASMAHYCPASSQSSFHFLSC